MNKKHSNLFKSLINAYYEDRFEAEIENILSSEDISKDEFANIISSLCGVDVNFSNEYINDLKKAIKSYKFNDKIVTKVKSCSMKCENAEGKTKCESACPFNAIFVDKKANTTYIDTLKCTDCGFCVDACVNGNILDKAEFLPLANLLKEGVPVIAAVAPAITGQFGEKANINRLRAAFKKLGFTEMVEVAFFADMLTLKEAVEFDEHIHTKDDFMITSCCCPMWVGMVKRVYGDLVKHVTPSVSPMIAAGRVLKKLNPKCKVVFVGPCVAKKAEAKAQDLIGDIDFVLTFNELQDIFDALNIHPEEVEEDLSSEYPSRGGRLYARTGGVSKAVGEAIERLYPVKYEMLKAVQGNGVKECRELLSKAQSGKIEANFIEGMGCVGGCVGGPKSIISTEEGREKVNAFAEKSKVKVAVDSACMNEILHGLDIHTVDDFKDKEKTLIFHRDF
ncbi:[Fe-Fe] hydrogenase large subunit C-terminal domain-containing protein [Oceanirhabdus sp. W0125-5]|uniref:[Fe-Fe] hydrogenase large subunit C-terminal domain-containing protein n=1 Tax=Oceanirhabdus sp. W0125-5 TaxID=2999116 RepID=UPI0022F3481C|nr:[Fe-Fe] hydrogenase large subunit C-terminal domain-containing protein [Oceanirhabdus sp. W0125-5]WBW99341.1 [Fe-Fe] hydrogenase large subunit C-terminal domain-containing protein [Oceanirhabdus sp. W0125-5]